jgi:Fur-regulated basic protein A
MPFLRNAVQRRRIQVISLLVNSGVFSQEDVQSLTLSELETEYRKLSNSMKERGNK